MNPSLRNQFGTKEFAQQEENKGTHPPFLLLYTQLPPISISIGRSHVRRFI